MDTFESNFNQSFNASYMSFEDVAHSFIISEHFLELIKFEHTVLTGSRGCGKTTLLKMLHPKAMEAWKGSLSNSFGLNLNFFGIYIPSDRQWQAELDTLAQRISDSSFVKDVLRGVLNANVLVALCHTFSSVIELNHLSALFEINLSIRLIQNWNLPRPLAPNLNDIIIKIRNTILEFDAFFKKADLSIVLPDFCYVNFINLVSIALDSFESVCKLESCEELFLQKKWFLCFDELEVTPAFFKNSVVEPTLRAHTDQRILLKVTSTPGYFDNINNSGMRSTEGDDFTRLKLWLYDNKSQEHWRRFSETYLKRVLNQNFSINIEVDSLLGKKLNYNESLRAVDGEKFKTTKPKNDNFPTQFNSDGIMYHVFKLQSVIDTSLYNYLERKGVTPSDPSPRNRNQESSVHRKIKAIVLYRYYFTEKSAVSDKLKLRSRNINAFNNGKELIFDIADGNPRALAHMCNRIVDTIKHYKLGNNRILIPIQARLIYSFCNEYAFKRIVNYPRSEVKIGNERYLLHELIDIIGKYFFDKLVLDDFNPDPYIFFFVDPLDFVFRDFIDVALEAGAIFKVEAEIGVKHVRRSHIVYRLSYSLYPYYNLPKIDYNAISLYRIIEVNKSGHSLDLFSNSIF